MPVRPDVPVVSAEPETPEGVVTPEVPLVPGTASSEAGGSLDPAPTGASGVTPSTGARSAMTIELHIRPYHGTE